MPILCAKQVATYTRRADQNTSLSHSGGYGWDHFGTLLGGSVLHI
jgi:hypothetical protein